MRLQLDTHSFLRFVEGNTQLSPESRRLIEDEDNSKWLSMASVWELAIKISIGKLTLAQPLEEYLANQMNRNGIALLPIALPHVLRVQTLPLHHRDPFDRLIVAQSLVEDMPLVSADSLLDTYGIKRLW